jgi:ATP-dependent Lon protease
MPVENQRDIEDIPAKVRKVMKFILISNVDDALRHVLVKKAK